MLLGVARFRANLLLLHWGGCFNSIPVRPYGPPSGYLSSPLVLLLQRVLYAKLCFVWLPAGRASSNQQQQEQTQQ
jgi:hypothetical protein